MKPTPINTFAALGLCLAAAGIAQPAAAAPAVTRLNPPSALFSMGDDTPPYISRFLIGQRFDLQATIQADAGQTITGATFKIGSTPIPGTVTISPIGGGKFSATLRAYSNSIAGVKTLNIVATQSGGQTATAAGNFEIVGVKPNIGRKAKNIIYLIGDGMGIAHRTAARLTMGNVQMGKATTRLAMDTLPNTALLNIASLNSFVSFLEVAAYAASKSGVSGLTRSLAVEWGPYGIRVNGLVPGLFPHEDEAAHHGGALSVELERQGRAPRMAEHVGRPEFDGVHEPGAPRIACRRHLRDDRRRARLRGLRRWSGRRALARNGRGRCEAEDDR